MHPSFCVQRQKESGVNDGYAESGILKSGVYNEDLMLNQLVSV